MFLQLKEKENDTDYIIEETGEMVADIERVPDDPDKYSEQENPLRYDVDPQVIYDEDSTVIADRTVLVYDVGHPEDVEQEILDEKIDIPSESNIEEKGDVV